MAIADANWQMHIDGAPLPNAYRDLVTGIKLMRHWDQADMLEISMRAWDAASSSYRVVGENLFGPGASIVFRAGYGNELAVLGRFDLVRFEPSFAADGPSIKLVAYNGLHRLMDDNYPKDFGTPDTYTSIVRALAAYHGMEFDGEESREIKHLVKTATKRRVNKVTKDGKVTYQPAINAITKQPITQQVRIKSKVLKKAGESDLALLKWVAQAAGFARATVRYNPETGRDVLVFRKPRLNQPEIGGAFVFRYNATDDSTVHQFEPSLSVKGLPQGVRITGRSADRKRLIIVEAELDNEVDLLRRGASAIRVTRRDGGPIQNQDQGTFDRPGRVVMQVLGERNSDTVYDPTKRKYVQTAGRECIKPQFVDGINGSLEDLARAWLESRLGLWITARANMTGIRDTHILAPNQLHRFEGTTPEYDGWYMVRVADHTWTPSGAHSVDLALQKLGEVRSGAKKVELKTQRPPEPRK